MSNAKSSSSTKSSSRSRKRLGRGLSSLIGEAATAPQAEATSATETAAAPASEKHSPATQPSEIPVGQIAPNPYQPRREFTEEQLAELADSISQQGIIQPLVICPAADPAAKKPYVLIAGERRLRAAQRVKLDTVPCVIKEATARQMLEWALVENIQRIDLNPLERATAYREYMDRFELSHAQAAEKLGQARTTITNHIRVLDLHDDVQTLVANGRLTFGHAKVLAGLIDRPEQQLALARKAANLSLSVRQLEGMVASIQAANGEDGEEAKPKLSRKPAYIRDLEEQITRSLGTKVTIKTGRSKNTGRLMIDFYSLDEFDRIASLLGFAPDA